jgi:hypothetical protein
LSIKRKILVAVLVALIAAQIPFVYRRWQLSLAAKQIAATNASSKAESDARFDEFVGVIHAHTSLGGHSTGTFDELISGANSAGLDFVLMTEHWSDSFDTSALTLNGQFGRTLFIGGNEIDTADGDRLLMIPGSAEAASLRRLSTRDVVAKLHNERRLVLVTYPEKFRTWDADFDGIEVFNLHTAAANVNRLAALGDLLWSGGSFPELTFARQFQRPDANLARFDETAAQRNVSLFAGTDAHSNIGFHLFGDDAGHRWLSVKLDPYAMMFRIARVHLLLPAGTPVSRESIIEAIRRGSYFTAIDALGDASGFRFSAELANNPSGSETLADGESGGEPNRSAARGQQLHVSVPTGARIRWLRNGEIVREQTADSDRLVADAAGAYRVEVYRDDLGSPFSKMPWIISNPLFVR